MGATLRPSPGPPQVATTPAGGAWQDASDTLKDLGSRLLACYAVGEC